MRYVSDKRRSRSPKSPSPDGEAHLWPISSLRPRDIPRKCRLHTLLAGGLLGHIATASVVSPTLLYIWRFWP